MSLTKIDALCDTLFRPYHVVKLCCLGLFSACMVALAFWREPWVMLSLAGVGFSISHLLWWLAAPQKAPSPDQGETEPPDFSLPR
jgi:hypothetical protein